MTLFTYVIQYKKYEEIPILLINFLKQIILV